MMSFTIFIDYSFDDFQKNYEQKNKISPISPTVGESVVWIAYIVSIVKAQFLFRTNSN